MAKKPYNIHYRITAIKDNELQTDGGTISVASTVGFTKGDYVTISLPQHQAWYKKFWLVRKITALYKTIVFKLTMRGISRRINDK
jgi:hypothetical protein